MTGAHILRDYYDFMDDGEKRTLADLFLAGPQLPTENVHPDISDAQRKNVGDNMFHNKFLHNTPCPMGNYPGGHVPRPNIRDRLINDGFLEAAR